MTTPDIPPFAELIASLASIDDDEEAGDDAMDLEGINLSLSIELAIQDDESGVPQVLGSTPTQWIETTVMPAFHRLRLHIAVEALDG